jgi:predicted nucleic acid-binding protein
VSDFFDTTVLVAAMIEDEPRHEACAKALQGTKDGSTSVHCVLECFATLTGGRLGLQLSPRDGTRLVKHNVYERLSLISLSDTEYLKVLDAAGARGGRGGAVYDFFILACARKSKARRIYTLNSRHFTTFAPDLAEIIVAP